MADTNGINLKWYQKWWGVSLIGLIGLVSVALIVFLALTGKYWWDIKHGKAEFLAQTFYSGFAKSTSIAGNSKIDRTKLETANGPFMGNPNAPITIVAFFDYKCTFSKEAVPIIKKLVGKYSNVKVIIRNFPGESIHPGTEKLSEIAACAFMDQPDQFWGLFNVLFNKQDKLPAIMTDQDIANLAGDAGLNYEQLNKCLQSGKGQIKERKDFADGVDAGVSGTPTFFVNGEMVEGVVPFDIWENFVKNY
ncbi:MAG: thioredoxin domain-containing protein [Patescibacteria group bacterium]